MTSTPVMASLARQPAFPEFAVIHIEPRYFRLTAVKTLLGDPAKAKQKIRWAPEIAVLPVHTEMVAASLALAKLYALFKAKGYGVNVSME
jgi:GDPmannose 4,6-dehydratase